MSWGLDRSKLWRWLGTLAIAYLLLAPVALYWSHEYRHRILGPWPSLSGYLAPRINFRGHDAVVIKTPTGIDVVLADERPDDYANASSSDSSVIAVAVWRPRPSSVGFLAPVMRTTSTMVVIDQANFDIPDLTANELAEIRRLYVAALSRAAKPPLPPSLLAAVIAGDGGRSRLAPWGIVYDTVALAGALWLASALRRHLANTLAWRSRARYRHLAASRCPRCRYDTSASPTRCPECAEWLTPDGSPPATSLASESASFSTPSHPSAPSAPLR